MVSVYRSLMLDYGNLAFVYGGLMFGSWKSHSLLSKSFLWFTEVLRFGHKSPIVWVPKCDRLLQKSDVLL